MKKNKYDSYSWVSKVVNSCENGIHLLASSKLARNFFNRYNDYDLYIKLLVNIKRKGL